MSASLVRKFLLCDKDGGWNVDGRLTGGTTCRVGGDGATRIEEVVGRGVELLEHDVTEFDVEDCCPEISSCGCSTSHHRVASLHGTITIGGSATVASSVASSKRCSEKGGRVCGETGP